ncbi:MAG: L-lactate dehydrogenase [Malacoplasma sp.]
MSKNIKNRKVVLVGCGFVGMSFVYSSINQGIFDEYYLIDVCEDISKGNALDVSDAIPSLPHKVKCVKNGTYSDCADADIIVITAGLNQKPGETRIDLIEKNSKIMQHIASEIKKSGFSGITIIASNPVDILTTLYYKFTGFNMNKIIGSGTSLDSARLIRLISEKLDVSSKSISAYVIGEHGDTSISVFSNVAIGGVLLKDYQHKPSLSANEMKKIHKEVVSLAYKIISYKKATYYGIGAALSNICNAIIKDSNSIIPLSIVTKDSQGMFIGYPAMVNATGWVKPIYLNLSPDEKKGFKNSCTQMKKVFDAAILKLNN